MRIGLSLGGGGALGYAHIGTIRALEKADIPIDIINGSSMGAIIGGAYALHADSDHIVSIVQEVVHSIDTSYFNIYRYWSQSRPFLRNWFANAICDISALRISALSHKVNLKALEMVFGETEFGDAQIPFSCVAVDLLAGEIVEIDEGKMIDGVLPSIAIPGIFPPVEWEGKVLVDGGVLADVPVRELRQRGADFIIGIKLGVEMDMGDRNGFGIISQIEAMKEDKLSQWELEEADFHMRVDVPDLNIMSFDSYESAIARGYEVARKALPELQRTLADA
ncbi:MAG: patatin-like phospholipase family protein [Chloroflexota bacterium]|nr:patatin-like phospholipase family protein [Chloroflexota bacterium]